MTWESTKLKPRPEFFQESAARCTCSSLASASSARHSSGTGSSYRAMRRPQPPTSGRWKSLWRFGIAAEFVLLISAVALALILFVLLRPVSRDLALLAVFFNLVTLAVEAVAALNLVAALFPLGNAKYLSAFQPEQLYAMATLSVKSHSYGFGVALIFFGCECLVLGYLIFRSGYLPKALGVLMQIAGLSYLTNSFALLLAPTFAGWIFPAILVPAFVGEASLCLWLLVKGVNGEKWKLQASAQLTRSSAGAV